MERFLAGKYGQFLGCCVEDMKIINNQWKRAQMYILGTSLAVQFSI
jgi:hypothetical protein